jgi:autotransporter-associated beta strand protein
LQRDLTLSGILSGGSADPTSGLRINSSGTIALAANNSFSGPITVQSPALLEARHASALGATGTSSDTTVETGATLQISGGINLPESLVIRGQGTGSNGSICSISSQIARQVVASFQAPTQSLEPEGEPLSERESEVLSYITKGYAGKEIAAKMHVSINTVKTHLKHIYQKLHVRSRTEILLRFRGGPPEL